MLRAIQHVRVVIILVDISFNYIARAQNQSVKKLSGDSKFKGSCTFKTNNWNLKHNTEYTSRGEVHYGVHRW